MCWMETMDTYLFQANLLDQNGGVCWIYADLYWCYGDQAITVQVPHFDYVKLKPATSRLFLPYLIFLTLLHKFFFHLLVGLCFALVQIIYLH